MNMNEFLEKHNACAAGKDWAMSTCQTMQEAWSVAPDPEFMIWAATRPGVLTVAELRGFCKSAAESLSDYMLDSRSTAALMGSSIPDIRKSALAAYHESQLNCNITETNRTAAQIAWICAWEDERLTDAVASIAKLMQRFFPAKFDGAIAYLRENTKPNFD